MLIRLEHNGRIVHEIKSGDISGELTIGRSHTCTWAVPKEDTVSSSRHACLSLKGKAVWLKDLESTNGTFFQGKKIEKRKLAIGDKVGIGNCTLCVDADKADGGKIVSELLVLTGKTRGQKKPLNPPLFTIGSDPASSLVFLDMLVSRRHAEISIKEDNSCWIRDLGSKNGTSVNGLALRDDKERLLKDGDRIAISHLEMEFHDGAVKRSNKQAWLRMGILAATFVAALTLFWTYQHLRSPAEAFVRKARRLAAAEEFPSASSELEKAVNARHSASCQVAVEDLRRLLGLWETTLGLWTGAQHSLSLGKWVQASRDLGMLQAARKEAWEWNDKAPLEKDEAIHAKQMLDALLRAQSSIVREDAGYADLSEDNAAVKKALELKDDYPAYGEIVKAVDKARRSAEGALKRRADVLFDPLQALQKSFMRLLEAAELTRQMEFSKAMGTDLNLPSMDACTLDLRVSQARLKQERVFENLKVKAGQMAYLFSEIEKRVGRGPEEPGVVKALLDPGVMQKVLACDSLEQSLPKRSRRDAAGEYDRILGVEEFYTHLIAMPGQADPVMLSDLPFGSALTQTREAVQKIEALKKFLAQPDNQWLAGGKVAQQMVRLEEILSWRDTLVKDMARRAESGTGREALIAGGIVARLDTEPGAVTIKGMVPEDWVAAELKRLRNDLLKMNSEYTLANSVRQIEIRNEILRQGLPGDPMVRRMWSMRDAASQGM